MEVQSQEFTSDELFNELDECINGLAAEIEVDDKDGAMGGHPTNDVNGEQGDDDNVESCTDQMNSLSLGSPSEREHIWEDSRPMKLILVKVIYDKFKGYSCLPALIALKDHI